MKIAKNFKFTKIFYRLGNTGAPVARVSLGFCDLYTKCLNENE